MEEGNSISVKDSIDKFLVSTTEHCSPDWIANGCTTDMTLGSTYGRARSNNCNKLQNNIIRQFLYALYGTSLTSKHTV